MQMITILVVLLAVVTIGLIVNGVEDSNKYTKISFKESLDLTDLPVITFIYGPEKLHFLLDSGANKSVLDERVFNTLNIPLKEDAASMPMYGIEGTPTETKICSMTISYKEQDFTSDFCVIDLSAAFDNVKNESGITIHGILGNSFFTKYKYVLDFDKLVAYNKYK